MRYYLAGPMTGIPQFNFPAFHAAAAALRAKGYEIVSPAEMDSPSVQVAAVASTDGKLDAQGKIAGETWGEILARDVQVIADTVRGIVFLPGWTDSRGARLEATVGLLQKGFLFYNWSPIEQHISAFSREAVAEALYRKFRAEAA
jgi:hypothetical protein